MPVVVRKKSLDRRGENDGTTSTDFNLDLKTVCNHADSCGLYEMYINIIFDRSTNVEHTTSISNSTFILWRSYCFLIYLFFSFHTKSFLLIVIVLIYQSSSSSCGWIDASALLWIGDHLNLKYMHVKHTFSSVKCVKYKNGFDDWFLLASNILRRGAIYLQKCTLIIIDINAIYSTFIICFTLECIKKMFVWSKKKCKRCMLDYLAWSIVSLKFNISYEP